MMTIKDDPEYHRLRAILCSDHGSAMDTLMASLKATFKLRDLEECWQYWESLA